MRRFTGFGNFISARTSMATVVFCAVCLFLVLAPTAHAKAHCFCEIFDNHGNQIDSQGFDGYTQNWPGEKDRCRKQCSDIWDKKTAADLVAMAENKGIYNQTITLTMRDHVGTSSPEDTAQSRTAVIPPQLPPAQVGVLYPKYQILTLLYAPPGCTGTTPVCPAQGEVEYEQDSSCGSKVSTDKSFKVETGLSVDATLGAPDFTGMTFGGNVGFSAKETDSYAETISKEQDNTLTLAATKDGVDHDQDAFLLLMNPAVAVKIQGGNTWWNIGYKGKAANVARISVSDLKNCSAGSSSPYHLTSADCNMILKQDPFANGSVSIDTNRFVQTTYNYSYLPSSSCVVEKPSIKNEFQWDVTHGVESEITVGYSAEGSASYLDLVKLHMKYTQDFTWTNSSSVEATQDSTQSAKFTLPCPASDTGSAWMVIYWDTLYGTFMFMPTAEPQMGPVIQQGHVSTATGKAAPQQLVALSYGGKTYHTSTDRNGNYRFFLPARKNISAVPAIGQLSVGSVKQSVPLKVPTPTQLSVPASKPADAS